MNHGLARNDKGKMTMNSGDQPAGDDEPSKAGNKAAPSEPTNDEDRNADRRDARSRKAILKRLLAEVSADPSFAEHVTDDLASLMPPRHRMSTSDDIKARLVGMLERDAKAPHRLNMKRTKLALDVESKTTPRAHDKLNELVESDEDLLAAFVANERLRGLAALQLAEHDAARRAMIAELGRRYTLAEQWRYKVPQFLLPLVAVMLEAGVSRDDIDNGRWLLSEIIELLLARSDKIGLPKDLAKKRLEDAAANVERQFEALVPEVLEGPSSPFLQQIKHEKLVETQARLKGIVLNLQKIALRRKDPDEREKRNQLWWSAKLLEWMGAGIDDLGRPVFGSVEAFRDGIEHLIDRKHLAKGERFDPPKDGPHF